MRPRSSKAEEVEAVAIVESEAIKDAKKPKEVKVVEKDKNSAIMVVIEKAGTLDATGGTAFV